MESGWRKSYVRYQSYFLNIALHYKEHADARAYLEIIMSLITIIIFSLLALKPTLVTIAQLLKEIESKEQTIALMTEKIDKVAQAQSLYDQQHTNILLLESAVPKKPQPDSFIRHIEGLAGKHALGITNVSVGKAVLSGSDVQTVSARKSDTALPEGIGAVSFVVTGSAEISDFGTLSNFYKDFVNQRRSLQIDTVNISTNDRADNNTRLVLTIDGRIPYLLETTPPVQAEATQSEEELPND